ncbi:hypothetical protein [Pigmentiphaga litoralis]|uniref:aromatic-ring hydroxylase C-terminal domain-containing protein n=1 Tax=Pigmentiphaga litoralis TaxID=516702 RepID=UPI00389AC708
MGLQIGHRYEASPICMPDGSPPTPDDFRTYVPTTRPGSRAPHVWLADGRSTLDLFGAGFVVLNLSPKTLEQARTLHAALAERGVPSTVVDLDEGEVRTLYEYDVVLVRPDGHVAWRGNVVTEPEEIADVVRGAR